MFTYILGAASVVVMCSAALVYLLIRYNMINANSLMTIGASTLTGSLFLPVIKAVFVKLSSFASVFIGIAVSVILFFILVFCISYTLSSLILDGGIKKLLVDIRCIYGGKGFFWTFSPKKEETLGSIFRQAKFGIASMGSMSFVSNVSMPVELQQEGCPEFQLQKETQEEEVAKEEPAAEKEASPVECLEQCIEKAFDCKEKEEMEEALLYYRIALDYKPQKELATWIVAEICSVYKELGQSHRIGEFLEEILNRKTEEIGAKVLLGLQKAY